jgi:hypothetical protein
MGVKSSSEKRLMMTNDIPRPIDFSGFVHQSDYSDRADHRPFISERIALYRLIDCGDRAAGRRSRSAELQ